MSSFLIIDGYNIINKWPQLIKAKSKSMGLAREKLQNIIQMYCDYTGAEGVIVFDGNQEKRTVEKGNPTIIYSARGESADTVIESLVYNRGQKSDIRLVTDDRAQGNMVTGMGAFVSSTKIFEIELKQAIDSLREFLE